MGFLKKSCVYPGEEEEGFDYIQLQSCVPSKKKEEEPQDPAKKRVCCETCCVRGCVIASLIAAFFIIVIPAGFILMFIGIHKHQAAFIGGGVALVIVPLVIFPSCYIYTRWRRIKKKDKQAAEKYLMQAQT